MNWLPLSGKTQKLSTSFLLSPSKRKVTCNRRQREGGRTVHHQIQIDCPKVASEYGKFVGGEDQNDQMTRVCKGQKQMQWYM